MSIAWSAIETGLVALRVLDGHKPRSYRDGADVPASLPVPVVPRATPPPEVAAQTLDATPDDFEPGLLEDLVGMPLTPENVEALLDEMVRPALNADGGDISLVRIEDNDIYVRLIGACNTCPSSVMTMRMGVERLLQEEFPQMGELIQVDDGL